MKPKIQNINSFKNLKKIDSNAILVLQNGKFFKGLGLGYQGTATGEVCFNTSITGYQEKVEEMKEAIMKIVKDLESHVVQDVLIAQKVHPVSLFINF